ncbi:MAG TPA: hypothetical protein DFR83_13055 [Deltaproteobacteria bacterium]|nr:hypothetical protein [Deltaproteobacteria bacterium]
MFNGIRWWPLSLFAAVSCGGDVLVTRKDDTAATPGVPATPAPPFFSSTAAISPPSDVRTGTTLTCTAAATTASDDPLTTTFEWTVSAQVVATGDTYTVTATDTDVTDRIDCTATAASTDDQTITSSASVIVENTEPVVSEVTIAPSTGVVVDSVLTCLATVTDPDEDGLVPSYTWLLSETDVATGPELALETTGAQPLDSVVCQVSVFDSHGGSAANDAMVTIENRLPTAPLVEISPDEPTAAVDDLVCSASGATDADEQSLTYRYSWVSDQGDTESGDTVPAAVTLAEETWTCTAVVSDGIGSASASASVLVVDTSCGETLTDVDGNTYATVELGSQCWMASNLNATSDASGTAISRWCCDCSRYGGMYDWSTVMNGSTTEGTQGICPTGWHVPSDADWFALESHLDASLTDPSYVGWNSTQIGDDLSTSGPYGFDWLTGGFGSSGNGCNYDYDRILYWTSTDHTSTEAVSRLFNTAYTGSNRDYRLKAFGFYVRCLKD